MDRDESLGLLGFAASLRRLQLDVRTVECVTPLPPTDGRCHRCGAPCVFISASFCDDCLTALTAESRGRSSISTRTT